MGDRQSRSRGENHYAPSAQRDSAVPRSTGWPSFRDEEIVILEGEANVEEVEDGGGELVAGAVKRSGLPAQSAKYIK